MTTPVGAIELLVGVAGTPQTFTTELLKVTEPAAAKAGQSAGKTFMAEFSKAATTAGKAGFTAMFANSDVAAAKAGIAAGKAYSQAFTEASTVGSVASVNAAKQVTAAEETGAASGRAYSKAFRMTSSEGQLAAGMQSQFRAVETGAAGSGTRAASGFLGAMKSGLLPLGALIAGAFAIKASSNFDTQMTRIQTQAGASAAEVKNLRQGVLDLAGPTAQAPDKLAEALFHVESVGYRGANALGVLKLSAQEAAISGANLDDTTYSLTSTMKTFGDTGVAGATKDMSLLNAIVGQGDMHFQDLNSAIQTGILSTGQTFGVSLQSMGAALTYLTDRGEKANVSATRLSMGIVLLAAPAKQAAKYLTDMGLAGQDVTTAQTAMQTALHASGLTTTKLADDLRKPDGIYVALKDLTDKMREGGLTADETAALIAKVFGGARTGKAVMALVENLEGVRQKYEGIGYQASRFGEDFIATTQTLGFKWHSFISGAEAGFINFGHALTPVAETLISGFTLIGHAATITAHAIGDNIPVVVALAAAYAALNFERIIGRVSDISLAFEGMRLGTYRALDGMRALGSGSLLLGGALSAGLLLVTAGAVRTFADLANSSKNVQNQFAAMTKGMNTGDISAIDKRMAELANQLHHTGDAGSVLGGVFNQLTGGIFGKTGEQIIQTQHALEQATIALSNQKLMVTALGAEFGISKQRVAELATTFGVDLSDGTVTSTQKFEDMYKSLGTLPANFYKVQTATADTTAAQNAYNDAITSSINLATGLQGSLLNFNSDLLNLGRNLVAGSRDISDNTAAGIQNQQALIKQAQDISGYAAELKKSQTPLNQQQALVYSLTKRFYDQMIQLHFTKKQADDLLTSYGLIPPDKNTDFTTPGLTDAISNTSILAQNIRGLNGKTLQIIADTGITGWLAAATGIQQTKTANGSTYNANGSNPLTAGTLGLPGGATGGLLRGPGTGTSDSILGVNASGIPTARVSNGEFVVNAAATDKWLPLLTAINGYAAGGIIRGDTASLMNILAGFPDTVAQTMASQVTSAEKDAVNKQTAQLIAQQTAAAVVGGIGSGVAQWIPLILQALAMEGLPASLASRVEAQMSLESGGNPMAINLVDSNAAKGTPSKGLLQTIDGTFNAYHWPGTSTNVYDPLANIAAAINYGAHRYGPATLGMGFGHGYAAGGIIPGSGSGDIVPLMGTPGEGIVNLRGMARLGIGGLNALNGTPGSGDGMHFASGGTVKLPTEGQVADAAAAAANKAATGYLKSLATQANAAVSAYLKTLGQIAKIGVSEIEKMVTGGIKSGQAAIAQAIKEGNGPAQKAAEARLSAAQGNLYSLGLAAVRDGVVSPSELAAINASTANVKNLTAQLVKLNTVAQGFIDGVKVYVQNEQQFRDSLQTSLSNGSSFNDLLGLSGSPKELGGQLSMSLANIKSFTSKIGKLKSLGYSNAIIRDVANDGILQGGMYADMLLTATAADVKTINAGAGALTAAQFNDANTITKLTQSSLAGLTNGKAITYIQTAIFAATGANVDALINKAEFAQRTKLMDSGGMLAPGRHVIENRTGGYERVLDRAQTAAYGSGKGGVHIGKVENNYNGVDLATAHAYTMRDLSLALAGAAG